MHNCPSIAAIDKIMISPVINGCLSMNAIASWKDPSEYKYTTEIIAEQKFTHNIWLYVSMLYPTNNLS